MLFFLACFMYFKLTDLPKRNSIKFEEPFHLISHNGDEITEKIFQAKPSILFFGFTNCPDVCPIVSSNLRWVTQQLADDYGTNFSIISVTVDPWWDTQSVLGQYADERNLSWPHLTGDVAALEPIWESFHVGLQTYENTSTENESNGTSGRHHPDYLVDHSTATIIIDKDHEQRVRWNDTEWEPTLFVEDLQQLIDEN